MKPNRLVRIIFVCFAVGASTVAILSQAQSQKPSASQYDISTLVQACIANGMKYDSRVVESYTYTRKTTIRQNIKDVVRVEEIYPKSGRVGEKLVSVNGDAVSK